MRRIPSWFFSDSRATAGHCLQSVRRLADLRGRGFCVKRLRHLGSCSCRRFATRAKRWRPRKTGLMRWLWPWLARRIEAMRFCQNPSVTSWDFPCKFDTKGLRANTSSQSKCDGLSQDRVHPLRLRMMRHAHSLTAHAMEKCVERAFRFEGVFGKPIDANIDQWLLRAPQANSGLPWVENRTTSATTSGGPILGVQLLCVGAFPAGNRLGRGGALSLLRAFCPGRTGPAPLFPCGCGGRGNRCWSG